MDTSSTDARMDPQRRIRDTSGQDQAVANPSRSLRRRRIAIAATSAAAVLALGGWVASGWLSGARSFDASRLRIAEVSRGTLVRCHLPRRIHDDEPHPEQSSDRKTAYL